MNIGLQQNVAVPPRGVGVAPILGYPGTTPASVPAASVGANAPGSANFYGGQWILPLPVSPGAKIVNMSCDMVSNTSTAVTMEFVGRAGVVTSKIFGPANGVIATVWLLPTDADPNGYTVGDGEHVAIGLSFRDSVTGAWSSGAQQVPVIGCAVNATRALQTIVISSDSYNGSAGSSHGTFFSTGTDSVARIPLQLSVGTSIRAFRIGVRDNGAGTLKAVLNASTSIFSGAGQPIATSNQSGGNAIDTTISASGLDIPVVSGTSYGLVVQIGMFNSGISRVYSAEIDVQ